MADLVRQTIFISHATPGDNVFATWIASRLSMAGYEVWCDQQKLLGGEDFWQDIEDVLRQKTVKFILVISKNAFDENGKVRDGIQKEVALANILKRKINDDYFVIPMRIDDTDFSDFSIDFLRLNGIDCSANWASGFDSLIKVLERDGVVHSKNVSEASMEAWRTVHQFHTSAISEKSETLQSNWLPIEELPEQLHFYSFLGVLKPNEARSIASSCSLPCSDHGRLLVSFASEAEIVEALGESIPIKFRGTVATQNFLEGQTGDILGIAPHDARNKITSIIRQAWDNYMVERGLTQYEMSGRVAWWFPEGVPEGGKLKYKDFNGKPRHRAVSGIRGKKDGPDGQPIPRYYWHLGFTARAMVGDAPKLMLQARIIITEDKKTPLLNKTRLNSVRRSLTSMWFNDKWRSLTLGFCSWLADGNDTFQLPVANDAVITLAGIPKTFSVPISIASDPVSNEMSDATAERDEQQELQKRLSDPAFLKLNEELDEV